ncbi:gamma-glutamylcyclotransferase family protein [Paraburkholderia sp. J67]|uniref:gamma-glutamylcyclotransferase family protein n=1 Tax=Paraburkholderia sp. J67 TaxID=2805435 RepID=UPI002ABE0087|nr:gamma-glutamylcyclotransferase family protein [Paraburkholderia sp. J67]
MDRLVDMFFYGLHMDGANLAAKGVHPRMPRVGRILGHRVVVATKAILIRAPGDVAVGMVYALTHCEIDRLYDGLDDYRAEAFIVRIDDSSGGVPLLVPALAMVHVAPRIDGAVDAYYVARLHTTLTSLGLSTSHLPRI